MVAKGADGNPQQVPPLRLENTDNVRRFIEAIKRREINATFRQSWDLSAQAFNLDETVQRLSKHRCETHLS